MLTTDSPPTSAIKMASLAEGKSGPNTSHISVTVRNTIGDNIICLFIYLKSTTEGPEGHLYYRTYTKIDKYTSHGNLQAEKSNKDEIKHNNNTTHHAVQTEKNWRTSSVLNGQLKL